MSLSIKYRFNRLAEMAPTTDIVSMQKMIRENTIPNTLILHGPAGTGKTSIARLFAAHLLKLHTSDTAVLMAKGHKADILGYVERDMTRFGKADDVRELATEIENICSRNMYKGASIFVLDEFDHVEKKSQKKLIKVIDDEAVEEVYIIIITNHFDKLDRTVISRSVTPFRFHDLTKEFALKFVAEIARRENKDITTQTAGQIYTACPYPSPRDLIKCLEGYYLTGRVTDVVDKDYGVIYNIVVAIDDLARAIAFKKEDPEKRAKILDNTIRKLHQETRLLCQAKPGIENVIQAIAKFYEVALIKSPNHTVTRAASFTLNCILELRTDDLRGYLFTDLIRMFYTIAERRADIGLYSSGG